MGKRPLPWAQEGRGRSSPSKKKEKPPLVRSSSTDEEEPAAAQVEGYAAATLSGMIEGDEMWIMVEDELNDIAKLFTRIIHGKAREAALARQKGVDPWSIIRPTLKGDTRREEEDVQEAKLVTDEDTAAEVSELVHAAETFHNTTINLADKFRDRLGPITTAAVPDNRHGAAPLKEEWDTDDDDLEDLDYKVAKTEGSTGPTHQSLLSESVSTWEIAAEEEQDVIVVQRTCCSYLTTTRNNMDNQGARFVPSNGQPASHSINETGAPSASIVHDTMRHGLLSVGSEINDRHPLESRLNNWATTQHEFKMRSLQNAFGAHEPIRRNMELDLLSAGDMKPMVLGGPSHLHRDILAGNDTSISMGALFSSPSINSTMDFHTEMEKRMM